MGVCHSSTATTDAVAIGSPSSHDVAPPRCAEENVGSSGGSPESMSGESRSTSSCSRLQELIEAKRGSGDLKTNVVHIEDPSGRPVEDVYEGVHTGHVLGEGATGQVRLVAHRTTGVQYAAKCLDLQKIRTDEGLERICEEICIMCELDHPNIARLVEVYEDRSQVYLIQELCLGRELLDRLDEKPEFFTEEQCVRLVKQMLCSVRYLHSKGITHRDLKLENFLFSSEDADSELKMIDFGFSKHFCSGDIQHEAAGTPYTTAPEVIRGSYDEKCDIWAVGVITYLILSGYPPFGSCDKETCLGGCQNHPDCWTILTRNILRGSVHFDDEDWAGISPEARDFVRTLLESDPRARPTAEEAQKHVWLQPSSSSQQVNEGGLDPSIVKALVDFTHCPEPQRLVREVLSFSLLPQQVKHLQKEFGKLDVDGIGEVTFAALKCALKDRGLSEEDIREIFDAMRLSKAESGIHWHEFIAAALSQCQIDRRNLALVFERADYEHKGYITFTNCTRLLGKDACVMEKMWGESKCAFDCERITYADYLKFVAPLAR